MKRETQRKIRILYVISGLSVGGAEKSLISLCKNLDKDIFEVDVVSLTGGVLIDRLKDEVGNVLILSDIGGRDLLSFIKAIYRIIAHIDTQKPSIVHSHLFLADLAIYIISHLKKIVWVRSEHNLNQDDNLVKKLARKLFTSKTKMNIAISQATHNYLRSIGVPKDKIIIIPYILDIVSRKTIKKSTGGKLNILAIGRLVEQKGFDILISAISKVPQAIGRVSLTIVGNGPEKSKLVSLTRSLRLTKIISFLEPTIDESKYSLFLASADLFILSSRWEGLGIVLLEAMAVGLPILSTPISSSLEVLGKGGTYCSELSSESLGSRLNELIDDNGTLKKMSRYSLNRFDRYYSKSVSIKLWIDFYNRTLTYGLTRR